MSHLAPPPVHPSRRVSSASPSRTSSPRSLPPALPPRYDDINRSTPQLPRSMPGSVEDLGAPLDAEDSMDVPPPPEDLRNEEELSEVELREMYDSEEIDRFLHIFQTYVSEVKAVGTSPSLREKDVESHESSPPRPEEVLDSMIGSQTGPSTSSTQHTLSEWCAQRLIVWLPTEQQHFPELSLKQVHMTVERTYLALLPTYLSLFGRVIRLATWKDYSTSLVCCLLYWFLWAHGLLFPAACICLLYSLLRRRFLPYPTLAELRRRRHEVNQAEQFGAALSKRLAMSSSFQVKDAWYLFKEFRKTRKEAHGKETVSPDPETVTIDIEQPEEDEDFDSVLSAEELTLIQLALFFFSQLSDFHERARNLFLWRRPQASLAFAILLFSCAIISAMPAVYISRLCGLAVGLVFWHLSPVIAALPPSDRMRIIPPSWPVPTDAEYAMELISQRVARGLEVRPRRGDTRRSSLILISRNLYLCRIPTTDRLIGRKWGSTQLVQGNMLVTSRKLSKVTTGKT
ncbi:hypothetical protein QCA50_001867 [Cerrena zonata]|uniref:Phosphoribosyltransferase C-terminal domain-containing protein n=1 Tax=Cerrena zonata TaxID=2478898 RepID=A0AAW0GS80_9APHY